MRINSAKDDAAGLQIADRLTTQINGLNQGNRNTNDGIALAQTMEGALDETNNMLQKIRTLAVQAVNGTNTQEDRNALKKEANALMTEVTRIAQQTKFGGKTVLNGTTKGSIFNTAGGVATSGQLALQLGANKGDEITFAVDDSTFSALAGGDGDAYKKANGILLSAASSAREVINLMDSMIAKVDNTRSNLGALQNYTHANHSNIKQYNLVYLF